MFQPWRGKQWGQEDNFLGGLRILVLGESHYDKEKRDLPDATEWIVGTHIEDKMRFRFFTQLSQLLSGRHHTELTRDDRAAIWHSVVFYNYVPFMDCAFARQSPSVEAFRAGAQPFVDLVRKVEAEAVLVCGARLWRNMPSGSGRPVLMHDSRLTHDQSRIYEYSPGNPYRAVAVPINHPSTGFNARMWRPTLEWLLDAVRAERRRIEGVYS